MNDYFSIVCVDLLALAYSPDENKVRLGLVQRDAYPYTGEIALPGVVVVSGERLVAAAERAAEKLGVGPATGFGQLRTFDDPHRAPRGRSLSVAMWATFPASALETGVWVDLDKVPDLPFDHNLIVQTGLEVLAGQLWRDRGFSAGLTGPTFSAADAVAITAQVTGVEPHRANLNRVLDSHEQLKRIAVEEDRRSRVGRPGAIRAWT